MVTAVGAEGQTTAQSMSTKTVKRPYLLQVQVRNLFSRTTKIKRGRLNKLVSKGIGNQWLRNIGVYGLDDANHCHCGLEIEINWTAHTIQLVAWGDNVQINKTVFMDDCAPEVDNAIEVFNQAVIEQCLWTERRVRLAPGVNKAHVQRELGLEDAPALTWAGNVEKQSFGVKELPELTVSLLFAESAELVTKPQTEREYPHNGKTLFDLVKDAFG
jgi:hypothetical protein